MNMRRLILGLGALLVLVAPIVLFGQILGDGPRLDPNRPTQEEIEDGVYTIDTLVNEGLIVFSTPFNRFDGYGDGPIDPGNTHDPGGRPVLGTLPPLFPWPEAVALRVNGLDASSCLDCHGQGSLETIPPVPAIGGVGTISNQVVGGPTNIDVQDSDLDGIAGFDGRFINPPFNFGTGGVELLAKEMTQDLRTVAQEMWEACQVDTRPLWSKGVYFGMLYLGPLSTTKAALPPPGSLCALQFKFSGVVGLNKPKELLVAPFGRKGEAFSIRDFDQNAMRFHFGMEPTEKFPGDPDHDDDGVLNEILPGDLSMLTIFQADLPRPVAEPLGFNGQQGYNLFIQIGCSYCHRPVLETRSSYLPVSFPEEDKLFPTGHPSGGFGNPFAYSFLNFDLTRAGFEGNGSGGLLVPLFADLKRHVMGDRLSETAGSADTTENQTFTTARLWGVCDTQPYLHDGRAFTLNEAIERHGGDAAGARNTYVSLDEYQKNLILEFLCKLRTPVDRNDGTLAAPNGPGETTAAELLQRYEDAVAIYGENPSGVPN